MEQVLNPFFFPAVISAHLRSMADPAKGTIVAAKVLPGETDETLKNMNAQALKYGTWTVKVIQAPVDTYSWTSRIKSPVSDSDRPHANAAPSAHNKQHHRDIDCKDMRRRGADAPNSYDLNAMD